MQVLNVSGSGETVFQGLTTGMPARETMNYFSQMGSLFDSNLTSVARDHFQEINQFYKAITIDEANAALRNLQVGLDSLALPNHIIHLRNLEELQHAPDVMIPWIMANPVVRDLFENNQIEGYGDRFNDIHGDLLGDTTPLHQAAINGIRMYDGTENSTMTIFAECSKGSELSIEMPDQISVIDSWADINHYLANGDRDPTSQYNGKL